MVVSAVATTYRRPEVNLDETVQATQKKSKPAPTYKTPADSSERGASDAIDLCPS